MIQSPTESVLSPFRAANPHNHALVTSMSHHHHAHAHHAHHASHVASLDRVVQQAVDRARRDLRVAKVRQAVEGGRRIDAILHVTEAELRKKTTNSNSTHARSSKTQNLMKSNNRASTGPGPGGMSLSAVSLMQSLPSSSSQLGVSLPAVSTSTPPGPFAPLPTTTPYPHLSSAPSSGPPSGLGEGLPAQLERGVSLGGRLKEGGVSWESDPRRALLQT